MVRTVKKPEIRRQEIIAAAQKIFTANGYENTTMQHVMDELGIAKGTIYHYFNSKEALFEAVIEQAVDDYIAAIHKISEESAGPALARMQSLIVAGSVADDPNQMLESLHSPSNVGVHTRQIAATVSRLAPLYAEVIEQGCAEGVFDTDHPLECAEFLLASVQFLTDLGVYPWEPGTLQRRALAFPALIEAQLKAPQGSFDFLLNQ